MVARRKVGRITLAPAVAKKLKQHARKPRQPIAVWSEVEAMTPFERLIYWIKERERIRIAKESGAQRPWTDDPILNMFRFCNVRREDDKVTRWIAQNWRTPHADDPDLWFAMVVARHINLPETLEQIGYPLPWMHTTGDNIAPHKVVEWGKDGFTNVLTSRRRKGLTSYNGAYMIRAGRSGSKAMYLRDKVFTPLWLNRAAFRPVAGDTLAHYHENLVSAFGMGSFMAAQVVADIKYVGALKTAPDWQTFAASGPGSRRGLNLLLGRELKANWNEDEWRAELGVLQKRVNWATPLSAALHAQDLQNCLCEYSKYEKARLGLGRPKQLYS